MKPAHAYWNSTSSLDINKSYLRKKLMRYSTIATVILSISLLTVFGCESPDSGLDGEDLDARASVAAGTVCDFGSATITIGNAYKVSIQNKNLANTKSYFVEVELGGSSQSPAGKVSQKGLMVIDVKPLKAGSGTISVYETKFKKGVEQRKLAAQCAFRADEPACAATTCVAQGATCGTISDNCGKTLNCGGCNSGQSCNVDNKCVNVQCPPLDCAALGAVCGTIKNECGNALSCGSCSSGSICNSQNQCVVDQTCTADSQCAAGQVCANNRKCVDVPASCSSTFSFFTNLPAECGQFEMKDYCPGFNYTFHYGKCAADQFCNPKKLRCESYATCELKTCEQMAITCSLMCSNTYLGCGKSADCCYRLGAGIKGPDAADWPGWEMQVRELINKNRVEGAYCRGEWFAPTQPLPMDEGIRSGARAHAQYMAEHGYGHATNLGGLGENIARGQMSPDSAVQAWMASDSGHCELIMNPRIVKFGAGFYYNGDYFWVSRFGL